MALAMGGLSRQARCAKICGAVSPAPTRSCCCRPKQKPDRRQPSLDEVFETVPAVLMPVDGERFAGRRVFAFAGIGRPQKFFAALRGLAAELTGERAFPDHYPFRPRDIEALRRAAERERAQLVTTAKDFVRLPPAARAGIEVLEVEIRWPDPHALARILAPVVLSAGANGTDPDRHPR